MMNDFIIEPVRSSLIKGFDVIKSNSLKLGAIGSGIDQTKKKTIQSKPMEQEKTT